MSINHTSILSEKEIGFLDQNGYLLLENILNADQIKNIKKRIEEIKQEEGSRVGDVRYGRYRKSLIENGGIIAKIKLLINSLCFKMMKFMIVQIRKRSAFFNQVLYSVISDQSFYRDIGGFRADMNQMLLNIVQQQETKVDRLCNLANKGPEFDIFFTHPKILACLQHIIGDEFKLSSLNQFEITFYGVSP